MKFLEHYIIVIEIETEKEKGKTKNRSLCIIVTVSELQVDLLTEKGAIDIVFFFRRFEEKYGPKRKMYLFSVSQEKALDGVPMQVVS